MSFGLKLRQLRERAGKSQANIAQAAGYDHSFISRLEGGYRDPSREAVETISKALGLSEMDKDVLLASAGYLPSKASHLLGYPILRDIGESLDKLPPDFRAMGLAGLEITWLGLCAMQTLDKPLTK
jgi:transcriptional regulator with XRE-family HTH domain